MKLLYLYSEIMPYLIPVFKEYVQKYNAEVHVVHWDHKKLTPYVPEACDNVFYYNRSEHSKLQLKSLAKRIAPNLIYISGWMDRDYLAVVTDFRKRGTPVVVGFDEIWLGNLRQRIGSFIFPVLMKRYFSHAFVSFHRQYEYARRIGFRDQEIVHNLLSCDTELFSQGIQYLPSKLKNYPRTFLFVGRFASEKGIDLLVDAFEMYRSIYNGNWKLICIGNGDLRYLLENVDEIEIIDFLDQEQIVEITKRAGVFVLPSRLDRSPLVVHEFSCAGMPLILSDNVGTRSTFLIDNYNGVTFQSDSIEGLAKAMSTMSSKSDAELVEMSKRSFLISRRINSEMVAASFMSISS